MLLIKALDHPSPAELEKQTAFIFMLGQIGDPRAYEALRDDFIRQEGHRWRGTISLGACLTLDKVEDYVALALGDETGGALRALKETTGQDFGRDGKAWGDYLKVKGNLDSFRAKCRQYSVPILG
jgi:HEAT repeat protein